jgi:AbrB family looped-hinge helix DNA binding protein
LVAFGGDKFCLGALDRWILLSQMDDLNIGPAMSTLIVTAKGQITLSKNILKHLGVRPGEKIAVVKLPDGRIEVKAARPTGKISDVFGSLKRKGGPSLSIEQINKIIARGWAGKR